MTKRAYNLIATLLILFSLSNVGNLSAQQIDIGLYAASQDTLEVRLRSDFNFDTLISNVQFTIRWDASSGVNLGAISQAFPEIVYIPMQKSGPEVDDSGFRYQVFFGSGNFPMSQFGGGFTPGAEVVLFQIPILNGCSDFAVINDSWTGDVQNNGDYFVSLNARNRTGIIYTGVVQPCGSTCNDVVVNQSESICQGDSIFLEGEFQTTAGTYYDSIPKGDGCDSVIVTDLTVVPTVVTNRSASICPRDSLFVGGAYQNQPGTYYDTFRAPSGCDSIIVTNLSLIPPTVSNNSLSICQGDSIFLGGAYQTQSGVYNDTLVSPAGCDSIVITTLNVFVITSNKTFEICQGDSAFLGGAYQTQSGVYTDTFKRGVCDSICITTLTVNQPVITNTSLQICAGDSVFLGGAYQTQSGSYADTFVSAKGCDSIRITDLAVVSAIVVQKSMSICEGDSAFLGGAYQTQSGNYTDTFVSASGCDSICVTDLAVIPPVVDNIPASICEGDSFLLGGIPLTNSGFYNDTLLAANGCDSIVSVQLTVLPTIIINKRDTINEGDSLFVGGAYQTDAGIYTDTFMAANGCDSICITDLTVLPGTAIPGIATGTGFLDAYPNPFHEAINIELELPEHARVRLEVLTVDGRDVATLFEGSLNANEQLKTSFSPDHASNNLYLLRLITDKGMVENRKLLFIR